MQIEENAQTPDNSNLVKQSKPSNIDPKIEDLLNTLIDIEKSYPMLE